MNLALTPPVMGADFAKKREEWMTLLGSANGHQNCVYRQLYGLIHDANTYWWINETRRLAPRDSSGRRMLNGDMHRLIDRCFFKSQMVGIRRLIDRREKKQHRAVYSVPTSSMN